MLVLWQCRRAIDIARLLTVPEGDTIFFLAHRLTTALAQQQILCSELRWPSVAEHNLAGLQFVDIRARGKHLLMRLGHSSRAELTLHSHLRMDGNWYVAPPKAAQRFRPQHWLRAILETSNHSVYGTRLGQLHLIASSDEENLLGYLGPDLLGGDLDHAALQARIRNHKAQAIATVYLDQRVMAGLGTNLLSEACFLAGIQPTRPVAVDADLRVLHHALTLIRDNRLRPQRNTTGRRRPSEFSYVFGRATCLLCHSRTQTQTITLGLHLRELRYCPDCQQ